MLITKDYVRHLKLDDCDLDNLILLHVQLANIIKGCKEQNWTVPNFLTEKFDNLTTEVEVRIKAKKLKDLSILKLQRQNLSTKEELRAGLDVQIKALEEELKK